MRPARPRPVIELPRHAPLAARRLPAPPARPGRIVFSSDGTPGHSPEPEIDGARFSRLVAAMTAAILKLHGGGRLVTDAALHRHGFTARQISAASMEAAQRAAARLEARRARKQGARAP